MGQARNCLETELRQMSVTYPGSRTRLEADYFDQLDTKRMQQHHVRRLEQLGFEVILSPKQVA